MQPKPFTMYFTSFDTYESCPQQFLWRYGWGGIDLGRGPGKGREKPVRKSEHDKFLGTTIQGVIEWMYNEEMWKDPQKLLQRMEERLDVAWAKEFPRHYFSFTGLFPSPSSDELRRVCLEGIRGFLRTMKANHLLGPYARAEVDMLGYVNKGTPIGGKADLIIRREDSGVTLYDGKNSKTKGKYTNPDQLRWYALCFYLKFGRLPDHLAFIYYRYPYGTPIEGSDQVESGLDVVPFTKADIRGLAERAVDARKGMNEEKFEATPKPIYCKWCDWETVCCERQAQKQSRARKCPDSMKVLDEVSGYVDL